MYENIFLHYKTLNAFNSDLEAGNIGNESIVFIEEIGQLWNRNKFYGSGEAIPTNIPLVNHTEESYAIEPNAYHVWGVVDSLDITLATPTYSDIFNEYIIQFSTGDTIPTVSLPADITWKDGIAPILMANKTYQISIVDNLAIYVEF